MNNYDHGILVVKTRFLEEKIHFCFRVCSPLTKKKFCFGVYVAFLNHFFSFTQKAIVIENSTTLYGSVH